MAKNTNRVASVIASVAALGLATSSFAGEWNIYVDKPVTYAKEIFATPLTVTLSADDPMTSGEGEDEQTSVLLDLVLGDGETVGMGSELEVTLTLSTGATLGQAINWTDIETGGDESDLKKRSGSQLDGRQGDSSVTFKVYAEGNLNMSSTGTEIRVNLGSLSGYTGAAPVTVTPRFTVTGGPQQNFPTKLVDVKEVKASPAVGETPAVEAVRGTSNVIASSELAVTFTPTQGGQGNIDLANRAKLAAPQKQVNVATIARTAKTGPVAKDGKTSFAGAGGPGAQYDVDITVTGHIRAGDTVYYSADAKMDAKEALTVSAGTATGSFRSGNGTVYFVPNGTTAMSAGNLSATFSVEYDSASVVDPADIKGGGKLVYNGVGKQARAYAIPNLTHSDQGNVRIKCEAGGDATCTVFLDCNEQDGMSRFGELGSTIAAGATEHLTESEIAGILGIDDWAGRLSCDVLSANDVSVQVLVRSGESLVNNTYVD